MNGSKTGPESVPAPRTAHVLGGSVRATHAGIRRCKPGETPYDKKKDCGKEPEKLRPRHLFPWFWSCNPEQHPEHRIDFGAGTRGSAPAGNEFDGARWNGLHYSLDAKRAARDGREEGEP